MAASSRTNRAAFIGSIRRGCDCTRALHGTLTGANENGYHLCVRLGPEQNVSPNQEPVKNVFPAGRVMSDRLLGARRELVIEHNGREYRLRLTQNGKLILTA